MAQKRIDDPEGERAKLLKWRNNHPDRVKLTSFKSKMKKFDLTEEEYFSMFDAQNGVCAICGRQEKIIVSSKQPYPRSLAIDHDHATGRVRGLLCSRCNIGLGHFEDNPDFLVNAARYLNQDSDTEGSLIGR